MDVARDVIELFTCKDTDRCREIALKLDQLNTERQAEEQRIVAEIDVQLADAPDLSDQFCMIFDGDGWHRGVVGIVASRVVEKTGRPALVIAKDGDEAHGSGRSIRRSIFWTRWSPAMICLPGLAAIPMRSALLCQARPCLN